MTEATISAVARALAHDLALDHTLDKTRTILTDEITKNYPDLAEINDYAVEIADKVVGRLVKDISTEKRKVIQRLTKRALREGWDDDLLGAKIAEKVGLDDRGAVAVENFREAQIKNGVPKGDARRLSRAYAKRLRIHRGTTIARTEVQRVLMEAQRELWKQQQEDGELSPYAVRVTRLHKDERLCSKCARENGKRRSLSRTPDKGPPFHPNCRCYEELEDRGVIKTDPALVWDGTKTREAPNKDAARVAGKTTMEGPALDSIQKRSLGRLDRSPKRNWVEEAGGLPRYIEDIAVALHTRRGMTISRAIATAINRCRVWAAGGEDVNPDTRLKAQKALAEWQAMKARTKAKDASK